MNFEGISSILPVSLVGLIAIGSANSDWPDFVTQATYHGKSNEKQKNKKQLQRLEQMSGRYIMIKI